MLCKSSSLIRLSTVWFLTFIYLNRLTPKNLIFVFQPQNTMKRILVLITVLMLVQWTASAQVSFGKPEKINTQWQFKLEDVSGAQMPTFDASKWRILDLPHDWSVEGVYSPDLFSCTGFLPGGIGWYRKTLLIPAEKQEEKVFIYFEGVYNYSEVFVNGHSVGKRPNGYASFLYDLTPYIEYGKENVLAVRVDHSRSADSRWYTGSGIYRDVCLIYANPVHIDRWGVFYHTLKVDKNDALLQLETSVKNETNRSEKIQITWEILSNEQKVVAKQSKQVSINAQAVVLSTEQISIKLPRLWSVNNPYLYKLKTSLSINGKVVDENIQSIGIRTTQFDANKGFALNGEWMKIKGACIHHDAGCLGAAVPKKVWERRLRTLKAIGCNAIRMSHNPQATDVYDLCDELGLLVMDEAFDEWEFPKKKWLEGWNVGKPGFEGSASFFEEWSDRDVQEMVLRGRNHPSIIMWSIGNEVDYPNDPYSHPILNGSSFNQPVYGGYRPDQPSAIRLGNIAKRLAANVKQIDNSRPVTAALAGVIMSNETEYPDALDITGYNYTENRYDMDHVKFPNRIIYGSENGHGMEGWKVVRDKDYIFGQFLWTGIDHLGESRSWPSRGSSSGLLDLGGFLKPRGYFRQALWSDSPVIYIGTYVAPSQERNLSIDAWPIWNYSQGEIIRVVCYTNCEQSQLLLDGQVVGEIKSYDDNTGIITWDIPYKPGKLEAVGFIKGKETTRHAIQTSTQPHAIIATVDNSQLKKDKDIAHIIVQIVDENGVPVMISDNEITCTINGPASLLGMEANNNRDMGNYRDNTQRVYHGRLIAYIQTTGEAGNIELSFTAPWLKSTSIALQAD